MTVVIPTWLLWTAGVIAGIAAVLVLGVLIGSYLILREAVRR